MQYYSFNLKNANKLENNLENWGQRVRCGLKTWTETQVGRFMENHNLLVAEAIAGTGTSR